MTRVTNSGFIFASHLNSFHQMWNDANMLLSLTEHPDFVRTFRRTQFSRTAALLFVVAFEALINRSMDRWLEDSDRQEALAKEKELSVLDKLDMLLARAPMSKGGVDKSRTPWSHLREVIEFRNDYVHPRTDKLSYLEVFEGGRYLNLEPERIPTGLEFESRKIRRDSVVYSQTGIPRDPTNFLPSDCEKVKSIIESNIKYINILMSGVIFENQWIDQDEFKLIYPPGKTINDPLPPYPPELREKYGNATKEQ